jgi:hypothetical protein
MNKKSQSIYDFPQKRIFVCSPFAGDEVGNYKLANQYMNFVKYYGHIPFAPHALYPAAFPETEKGNREFGISCGLTFLENWADELWFFKSLETKEISKGMAEEIAYAKELEKPVRDMSAAAQKWWMDGRR